MLKADAVIAELPRLRRYARALTRDAHAADDLVQDTVERALGKLQLWRPGNVRAWLFSVMHNVYVNQVRGRGSVAYVDDEALPDVPVAPAQSDGLELRDLHSALGRLSLEHREVLLLVGLEEMSYEETARVLGVPMGTVMSRLSRARDRLRTLIAESNQVRLKVVR